MRQAISHHRNVVVLPFESLPIADAVSASLPLTESSAPLSLQTFPVYVQPGAEEALLSWLLRFVTPLGVSLKTLEQSCFGVDDSNERSRWWYRPGSPVLRRISEYSGVRVAELGRMTFDDFASCYRDDEANERFCGRRYYNDPSRWRTFPFVVCGQCLSADADPYVCVSWLLGWLAVCPIHNTVMISRCNGCRCKCRIAYSSSPTTFSSTTCTRCGNKLPMDNRPAASSVLRLQASMLKAKREGAADVEGLGSFTWAEFVALIDVLQGMFWTAWTFDEQQRAFKQYAGAIANELPDVHSVYDSRYGALRFLAWLTEGWPHGTGSTLGQRLLDRWLTRPRSRISRHLQRGDDVWCYGADDFGSAIRDRLRQLAPDCREA